jgi:predicted membrane channel-forming protein YqfA (hemolysin III family)
MFFAVLHACKIGNDSMKQNLRTPSTLLISWVVWTIAVFACVAAIPTPATVRPIGIELFQAIICVSAMTILMFEAGFAARRNNPWLGAAIVTCAGCLAIFVLGFAGYGVKNPAEFIRIIQWRNWL